MVGHGKRNLQLYFITYKFWKDYKKYKKLQANQFLSTSAFVNKISSNSSFQIIHL